MTRCASLVGAMVLSLLALTSGCAGMRQGNTGDGQNREASRLNTQLGLDYLRKNDTELGREKLLKAVSQDDNNAEAHGALGLLYANTGDLAQAKKHYEKSLKLQPDDANVLNNYGVMLCAQAEYEKADLQFRRAVGNTRYSSPELALTNAGVCARKLPDDAKAEAYLREAIKRAPNFTEALGQLALLSADQARYLNARAFLQRYQSLQAPMTREMLLLGLRIELALGNRDAAQRYAQALRAEQTDNFDLQTPYDEDGRALNDSQAR